MLLSSRELQKWAIIPHCFTQSFNTFSKIFIIAALRKMLNGSNNGSFNRLQLCFHREMRPSRCLLSKMVPRWRLDVTSFKYLCNEEVRTATLMYICAAPQTRIHRRTDRQVRSKPEQLVVSLLYRRTDGAPLIKQKPQWTRPP